MSNASKEGVAGLGGKSPSGREHYAAMHLRRPVDREGQSVNQRTMRKGIEKSDGSPRALFGRFRLDRIATPRMDSSASRLPEGVRRQMADARVIVVGCGALGSGVTRMLAQAGDLSKM